MHSRLTRTDIHDNCVTILPGVVRNINFRKEIEKEDAVDDVQGYPMICLCLDCLHLIVGGHNKMHYYSGVPLKLLVP